jgi:hypothetical protein
MGSIAGEPDGRLYPETAGIGHLQTEFSSVALGVKWESK